LSTIHDVLNIPHLEFWKQSSNKVELRGGEPKYDTQKLNSYPSKVGQYAGVRVNSWCIFQNLRHFQEFDGAFPARKTLFFRRMLLQNCTFVAFKCPDFCVRFV